MEPLAFACETLEGGQSRLAEIRSFSPSALVIAGWTGRDAAAISHHIEELAALGVPRPSRVPLYYRVAAQLLTQSPTIEVLGEDSSGEVEPVLFVCDGQCWLTVGSDHTDRKVEAYSVAVSKQLCAKPLAAAAWRWDDVADHQDAIELRSRIYERGRWVDYQRGTLAEIRPLAELRDGFETDSVEGLVMTCGTLPAIPDESGSGVRPATQMELELRDPVLGRRIVQRYSVRTLPMVA